MSMGALLLVLFITCGAASKVIFLVLGDGPL